MFRGPYPVVLDAKGRIALPTRIRDVIANECAGHLVATIETAERCLLLYPLGEWERVQRDLEALPSSDPGVRRLQRLMIGHAYDLETDSAGRITLPQMLRDYAGLDKRVVLLGQGRKLEIWNEPQWLERREVWVDERPAAIAEPAALQNFRY